MNLEGKIRENGLHFFRHMRSRLDGFPIRVVKIWDYAVGRSRGEANDHLDKGRQELKEEIRFAGSYSA